MLLDTFLAEQVIAFHHMDTANSIRRDASIKLKAHPINKLLANTKGIGKSLLKNQNK